MLSADEMNVSALLFCWLDRQLGVDISVDGLMRCDPTYKKRLGIDYFVYVTLVCSLKNYVDHCLSYGAENVN